MAGVWDSDLVTWASGSVSASTKVKDDSVDPEEHLIFSISIVDVVNSDEDPVDD
jgi:hypothetical protein